MKQLVLLEFTGLSKNDKYLYIQDLNLKPFKKFIIFRFH